MKRGFSAIGLFQPKTPANVGSALRAAHCYGSALLAYTGRRFHDVSTDTTKAYRHLPMLNPDDLFDVVPYDCVPVAVDMLDGARDLISYTHPERAFYLFGPEDGTLDKNITNRCRDCIIVPTAFCMNLAVCVNVVLYDRMAKERQR